MQGERRIDACGLDGWTDGRMAEGRMDGRGMDQ